MTNKALRRIGGLLGATLALGFLAHTSRAQLATLCAEVKLEILQEATLEREAFDANLKVNNNLPDQPLTDLRVNVYVKDEAGNPADNLFFIKVATLTNVNAVDGTGVVQSSSTAEIRWLIIPSTGAGGSLPGGKRYAVKATINGTSAGAPQSVTTFDDFITVYPQPSLKLEYVLPYEVFADEPLTSLIEPISPFPLGVRVTNVGYGIAKNFKIDSAQPRIVENKQNLQIDFKLLGTVVGGKTIPDTLLVPFGDVAPNGVGQASWIMSTTLSGRFVEFTSTFTHAAELGGQLTSLIQSVTTYTLLKDVLVDLPGRDATPDFLVNATMDRGVMQALLDSGEVPPAEFILESDQPAPLAVTEIPATISGTLGGSNATLTLTFSQAVGSNIWAHSSVPFTPPAGLVLQSARSADGRALGSKNVWISKHFRKSDLAVLYRLNILDHTTGASSYTINFDPTSLDAAPGAVTDLAVVTGSGAGSLDLAWSAPGEDGNTGNILGGRYMLQSSISPEPVFSPELAQVNFATSTAPGRPETYSLTGLAGNATTYLRLWTQDTGGAMSALSNAATAYVLPNPPRDLLLTAVGSDTAHGEWQGGNNNLPIVYQVYAATGGVVLSSSPLLDSFSRTHDFTGLPPATTVQFYGYAQNPDTLTAGPTILLASAVTLPAPLLAPADILPPQTSLSVGAPSFSSSTLYAAAVTTYSLSAIDDLASVGDSSGTAGQTFIAVDTTTFSPYTGPFTLSGEGAHAVSFYSVDLVGNVESSRTVAVSLDLTPPITSLQVQGSSSTNAQGDILIFSTTPISLSAVDPVANGTASGVKAISYVIDADPASLDCQGVQLDTAAANGTCAHKAYNGAFTLSVGTHTVYYFTEDNVANQETSRVSSFTVYGDFISASVDGVATLHAPVAGEMLSAVAASSQPAAAAAVAQRLVPVTLFYELSPSGVAFTPAASLLFVFDPGVVSTTALAVYTFNGVFWDSAAITGQQLTSLSSSSVLLSGNLAHASLYGVFSATLDALPPRTSLSHGTPSFSSSTLYVTDLTTFSLAAVDDLDSVRDSSGTVAQTFIAVDTTTFSLYPGPFTLSGEGAHTISFYSVDLDGNVESSQTVSVSLDRTPPVTTIMLGASSVTAVSGMLYVKPAAPVTLAAVDPASGVDRIEVSLDGGSFTAYAAALTFSAGSHTVQYRAIDKVGNEEAIASRSITVDGDAPGAPVNLLVNGANPSPWSNRSSFDITWNDPVDTAGVKGAHHHLDSLPDVFTASTNSLLLDLAGQLLNGSNLLTVWLEDNAGNHDPANMATATLRYDDAPPVSAAAAPSVSSTRPVLVTFSAQDPGAFSIPRTGGGVDMVKLWVRRDTNDDGVYGAWALAAATSPTGSFSYDPGSQDGNLRFYTQASDAAGNAEPEPLSATPPKAETLFDATVPALSNIRLPTVSFAQAQVAWQTDDQTTGIVEYGITPDFGRSQQTPLGRDHWAMLDCQALSPATIYYRITATNRAGLKTFSSIMSFATSPRVSVQTDPFGVVDPTQPIYVQVNNPAISTVSFSIDGQSGSVVFSTSTGFQIYLDASMIGPGVQTLRIVVGDFVYETQFIVDTATRAVRLARAVFAAGGGMTDPAATPGSSAIDLALGEAAHEEMSSSGSRLYLGYYSGIDPVAPAQIMDLSAVTGPGAGQVTLSWTAVGDDADVGTAMKYDLRRATYPVDALNFRDATIVALSTFPAPAGTKQEAVITGLEDGTTFYFALKAEDELLNASPYGPVAVARTLDVARSGDKTNGLPTVEFISRVPGVSVTAFSTTTISPAVALATSAAAAQGLLFYSTLYDIISPDPSLPGGATIQFRYQDPGDPAFEADLRVYEFKVSLNQWVMIADVGPNANQDLFSLSIPGLSFYAIMFRDAVSPVTSLEPRGGHLFLSDNGSLFASTSTAYWLTSQDPLQGGFPASGVSRSEFRVDSSSIAFAVLPDSSTFALPEGSHTVQFRSVDRAGNVEAIRTAVIAVDGAPPQISLNTAQPAIHSADGLIVLSTSAVITVDVRDPLSIGGTLGGGSGVSSITYSLDGGSAVLSTTSFSVVLGTGAHLLAVTAVDRVGNVLDMSSAPFRISIGDILAPRTTVQYGLSSAGNDPVYLTSSTPITLRSVDDLLQEGDSAGLGVSFQEATLAALSSGTARTFHFSSALSTFTASQEADGLFSLSFFSQDVAGNREAIKVATVAVDNTAPLTSLAFGAPNVLGADLYISTLTPLAFTAHDPLVNGVASGLKETRFSVDESSFTAYMSSFTLSAGVHSIAYFSMDGVGNAEVANSTAVLVDVAAPVTTVSIGSPTFTNPEGVVFVSSSAPVSLAAVDPLLPTGQPGAGLSRIEISIGTAPFVVYTATLTFAEGRHTVAYRAIDNVGNTEPVGALSLQSDATPPATTLSISTPVSGGYVSDSTRFVLAAVDTVVGVEGAGVKLTRYRVNGGDFVAGPLDYTLSGPDGAYTLEYQSEDNVGNLEIMRSTAVFLDRTPPVTTVRVGASSFTAVEGILYVDPAAPVTLAAVDPASGVDRIEVSLDSGPFTAYTAALTFAEGRHTVLYRAVDRAGNIETAQTLDLRSDATPPLTAFTPSGTLFTGADGEHFAPPSFFYALPAADPLVSDVASGLAFTRYSQDSSAFLTYATTFTLTEGVRRVDFQSQDNLGHLELLRSATVFVDATPPLTALDIGAPQFPSGGTLYVSTATPFSLGSHDPEAAGVASGVSGISFRLDAAAFTPYSSTFTISTPDGIRSVSWFAADNVGNVEAAKNASVALDATAPRSSLLVIGGRQAVGPEVASFYVSSDTRLAFTGEDPSTAGTASGLALIRFQDNGGVFQDFGSALALGEGRHSLGYQAQDNVLNLEVLRSTTVLVDATPPVTAISMGAPTVTAADGTIYVTPTSAVAFSAVDPALSSGEPGSGVESIEAAVDGGAFAVLAAPLHFPEGLHTVRYRALDRVGNVEAARTLQLRSDATPPASAMEIGVPSFQLSSTTVVVSSVTPLSITAQDPAVSGVASGVKETFYRVSSVLPSTAAFQVFAAPFSLSEVYGSATVEFFSRDQVLNTEPTRSRTLLLDSTAPEALIKSPRADGGICSVVKGIVPVRGTARDLHLASYLVESAPGRDAAAGFVLVSSGAAEVDAGLLGAWDARGLSGWQTLRLTVVDQVGNTAIETLSVFVGDPGRLLVLGNHETFNLPQGVAVDTAGEIYVADTNDDQIQVFSATGTALASFGRGHGLKMDDDAGLRLNKPKGVAVGAEGAVYVADTNNDRVLKLSATGQVLLEVGRRKPGGKDKDEPEEFQPGKAPGEFRKPSGLAVDVAGNIFVADTDNNRVQKLGSDGTPLLAFNMPPAAGDGEDGDRDCERPELGRPVGIALDEAGNIYVADPRGARALKFSPAGQLLMTLPIHTENKGGHHKPGRPEGIAVSPDGGCVLVSDSRSSRVIRFDAAGVQTLEFGERGTIRDNKPLPKRLVLRKPAGLALGADGKLYVADRNNDRVQVFGLPSGEPASVIPPSKHDHDDDHIAREVLDREEGGHVERDDRAGVSIPAGALAEDLKITVSTPAVAVENDRDHNREDQNLKVVSAPVEYGPEGTKFMEPVTLTLPYTPDLIAAQGVAEDSLKINYWNKEKGEWEALESEVDAKKGTVKAKTSHFSLYQVLGSTGPGTAAAPLAVDASFGFKDMYAFPNPARGVNAVTIRIQPGLADGVEVHVYDLAGRRIHASSDFQQTISDDGNGKGNQYTYDHVWNISGVGSGVYTYVVTARKSGAADIHKTGRLGVVK